MSGFRTLLPACVLLLPLTVHAQDTTWRVPPAITVPAPLALDRDLPNERSVSLGRPNRGELHNAVRLPESEGLQVLPDLRPRNSAWGSTQIISLLVDAAVRTREQHPDAILGVGNIGLPQGGPIRWSRSHQNGRDADLSFILLDERGRVALAPVLFHVDPDLTVRERPGWTFDLARNWALIEALVTSEHATLDWIFVSNPIRHALLLHAVETGAPAEAIERAAMLMRQPGDSLPHDDHFHVRVTCDDIDRYFGCTSYGPVRPFAPWDHDRFEQHLQELAHCALRAPEPLGSACMLHLDTLQTRESSAVLARALRDGPTDRTRPLLAHLEREALPSAATSLAEVGPQLPPEIRQPTADLYVRLVVADQPDQLCSHLDLAGDHPEWADALALASPRVLLPPCAIPRVARRVLEGAWPDPNTAEVVAALRRATFHVEDEVLREGKQAWLTRIATTPPTDHEAWLLGRLERALGREFGVLPEAPELLALFRDLPEHQDLLEAALSRRFGGARPSSRDPRAARERFWSLRLAEAELEAAWRANLSERVASANSDDEDDGDHSRF